MWPVSSLRQKQPQSDPVQSGALTGRHSLPSYDELYPQRRSPTGRRLRRILDPQGVLHRDLEGSPDALRQLAEARAHPETRDILLLSSNFGHLHFVANLVANLASLGIDFYFLLADSPSTCRAVQHRLACVWSSMLDSHRTRLARAGLPAVWRLWLLRHIYVGRLVRLKYNPMLLDADVVVFSNPFTLIQRELPDVQGFTLDDASAGYMGLNGGTAYVRNADPNGQVAKLWYEFERRTMQLLDESRPYPRTTANRPAAELLYDQTLLDHSLVGMMIGQPNYVRRGKVAWARVLNSTERAIIKWQEEEARTPPELGIRPPGPYRAQYTRISVKLGKETLLKAPPWLFSAESAIYRPPGGHRGRTTARDWHITPPPTALIHFVCTRLGSEGRKLAMRLLGKWHTEDILWALAPSRPGVQSGSSVAAVASKSLGLPPDAAGVAEAVPLIAFSSPLANWHVRGRGSGRDESRIRDRQALRDWQWFLAFFAYDTGRAPVLPLFECSGLLHEEERYGWVLHAEQSERGVGKGRRACTYRLGTCAGRYSMPEEVALTPASERVTLVLKAETFRTGGVEGLLRAVRSETARVIERRQAQAVSRGPPSSELGESFPRVLLLDASELAAAVPEGVLSEKVREHGRAAAPSPASMVWQNATRGSVLPRGDHGGQTWFSKAEPFACLVEANSPWSCG